MTHRALCHKRARLAEKKASLENSRKEAAAYKQRLEQLKKEEKIARSTKKQSHME